MISRAETSWKLWSKLKTRSRLELPSTLSTLCLLISRLPWARNRLLMMISMPDKRENAILKSDSDKRKSVMLTRPSSLLTLNSTHAPSREERLRLNSELPRIIWSCTDSILSWFKKSEESNKKTSPEEPSFSMMPSEHLKTPFICAKNSKPEVLPLPKWLIKPEKWWSMPFTLVRPKTTPQFLLLWLECHLPNKSMPQMLRDWFNSWIPWKETFRKTTTTMLLKTIRESNSSMNKRKESQTMSLDLKSPNRLLMKKFLNWMDVLLNRLPFPKPLQTRNPETKSFGTMPMVSAPPSRKNIRLPAQEEDKNWPFSLNLKDLSKEEELKHQNDIDYR